MIRTLERHTSLSSVALRVQRKVATLRHPQQTRCGAADPATDDGECEFESVGGCEECERKREDVDAVEGCAEDE